MKRPSLSRTLLLLGATCSLLSITGCTREQFLVFNPVGPVAQIERHLINVSILLVLIVVVPVMILLWVILHRYRDKPGRTAPYQPEWSESLTLEVVWWGIPIVIIGILGFLTVQTTFALTRPPEKNAKPVTIHAISLNWKWVFLYPDQKVATVNYVELPTRRPVQFVLTADAPMNSFWIPQLGGQEYSMPGMAMRLWLQADKPGTYFGRGAQFTGEQTAFNTFKVYAVSTPDFDAWAAKTRNSAPAMTNATYTSLQQQNLVKMLSYSSYPPNIFNDVVMADGGMYMKRNTTVIKETKK